MSFLIPVKNEEKNLPLCLESISWADEIIVVDSHSTDKTVEVSESFGAKVVQFDFSGTWPKKRNWALETLPFRNEWVFVLDADEVFPAEGRAALHKAVTEPLTDETGAEICGYFVNRRFMFMGKWLKHAYFPNWILRLFKHRVTRYEKLTDAFEASLDYDNEVHEPTIVQGPVSRLPQIELLHYAFPTVTVFVDKHNKYSSWEAHVALEAPKTSVAALSQPGMKMRRQLKDLSRHLPCRPLLRFLYVYIWQAGCLDGVEGFYFAGLHGVYQFLSDAKTYELRKRNGCSKQTDPSLRP